MKHLIPILCVFGYFWSFPVYAGCPIENRVLYLFSHANLFHLIVNIISYYALQKSLRFLSKKKILYFFILFGSVSSLGAFTETVGMSGAMYGLFGMCIAWYYFKGVDVSKQFITSVLSIALSFILPNIAGWVHFVGFLTGIIIGTIYGGIYGKGGNSTVLNVQKEEVRNS